MSKTEAIEEISEIDRSKKVTIPYLPPIQTLTDYQLNPTLKVARSFLEKTKKQEKLPLTNTPQLPTSISPKNTNALGFLIAKAIQENEEIIRDVVEICIRNIDVEKNTLKKLSTEDQQKLQERLIQLEKKETIDVYKSILTTVASATAIVIGGMIIAPEAIGSLLLTTTAAEAATAAASGVSAVWGWVLAGSGISNLATTYIMPRLDVSPTFQATSTVFNTAVGLTAAIATGSFISKLMEWSTAFQIMETSVELSSGITNFLSGTNQYNMSNLEAHQTTIQSNIQFHRQEHEKKSSELKNTTEFLEILYKIANRVMQSLSIKL